MKTILVTLSLAFSTLFINAQAPVEAVSETSTITVTVPVKSTEGNVVFGLYTEGNFMQQPTVGLEGEIVDGKATVTFTDVAPGDYAVILFHDKNKNKRMDFDASGMPQENYGMSNNVMSYGPPQWSDAKFTVADAPLELEIRF
ncbi:DUF2141 domain-containing protein [Ulvibacter litoralis]|uniref:Uncharacterized conserved protein, DUF2141 family n=1 Tax=Ulvibacter litoralis TaxID=227084 RepID=A0A1G7EZF6_9FLAO|nr:DUF2141 domain-containing protein [Ulvibacter litoralis]GHC53407.1 hypothetical protein GCM10008083_16770 [Ulvibacter litoralis]SDE68725.1 Uncharacterized conserved protein, DUF2141 family [Ulvibacter litoralis]